MLNRLDSVEYDQAWNSVGDSFMASIDAEMVKEFILAICGDEKRLLTLYERSYIHPLGFYKLEIYKSTKPQGLAVRLHYWPPGLSASHDDIHDHCFNFFSKVFVGEMCHEVYVKAEDGINYEEVQYSVDEQFNATYKVVGSRKLASKGSLSIINGYYSMDSNTLHKVIVKNPPCLSLLLRSPYIKKSASVYHSQIRVFNSKDKQSPERFSSIKAFKGALLDMHGQLVANKALQADPKNAARFLVG